MGFDSESFQKREDFHVFGQRNDHALGYIIERITDRWTDHIEFDGLLYLEPAFVRAAGPVQIERVDVRQICMQQPRENICTCNTSLRLDLLCCLRDFKGRRFQRKGYVELDTCFLKQRCCIDEGNGQNIRVAVRILQAQITNGVSRCDDVIPVRFEIKLEFVCSCQGIICGVLNMGMNKNMIQSLYPKPIECKRM